MTPFGWWKGGSEAEGAVGGAVRAFDGTATAAAGGPILLCSATSRASGV